MALAVLCCASCVNGIISETNNGTMLPDAEEQSATLRSSLEDIDSVREDLDLYLSDLEADEALNDSPVMSSQTALVKGLMSCSAEIDAIDASLERHIASMESGMELEKAAMTTVEFQKQLGSVTGRLRGLTDAIGLDVPSDRKLEKSLDNLEENVLEWLGQSFYASWSVAEAQARLDVLMTNLDSQKKIYDGVASDVEAGLRRRSGSDDLESLGAELTENSKLASELSVKLEELSDKVDEVYAKAVKAAATGSSDPVFAELDELNENVDVVLKSTSTTLAELFDRISACEEDIHDILERLDKVEADVDELLGLIQSVTFMSESYEDYAVAYYNMVEDNDKDGMMDRVKDGDLTLNWLVRPASAATALTDESLWNNDISVIAYYAGNISTFSVSSEDFVSVDIKDITADADLGLVTLNVDADFTKDFYFKNIGVKLALSIKTGKTDIASRFVEVKPKDKSGNVYCEKLELSHETITIKKGDTAQLEAYLEPENVTVSGVNWVSLSNNKVAEIDDAGKITGVTVGEDMIEVTTKGTDEYGRKITAYCKVIVQESITLNGPASVEIGNKAQFVVDYNPAATELVSCTWSADKSASGATVTITQDGLVEGVKYYYDTDKNVYEEAIVKCEVETLAGKILLTCPIKVVAVQPKAVHIDGIESDQTSLTMKLGDNLSLTGKIMPETVELDKFKIGYLPGNRNVLKVDFSSGAVEAIGPGTTNLDFEVLPVSDNYAVGVNFRRQLYITVEPYWVETISIPDSFGMTVGQKDVKLSVGLTSDVEGVSPSYPGVKWSSDNTACVTIDEETGAMNALAVGTAKIRVETTSEWATPDGQPLVAECNVTVTEPSVAINIGDYYYFDGTWSSELDPSKTVVGVVFAMTNATASDKYLRSARPGCVNGLVVSLAEYSGSILDYSRSWSRVDCLNWFSSNGYEFTLTDTSNPVGYSNTHLSMAINNANVTSYGQTIYWSLYRNVTTHRQSVGVPKSTSGWYLPSYAEMKMMTENLSEINASLADAGGTQISSGDYWCSTFYSFDEYSLAYYTFVVSRNGWSERVKSETAVYPHRVILAF